MVFKITVCLLVNYDRYFSDILNYCSSGSTAFQLSQSFHGLHARTQVLKNQVLNNMKALCTMVPQTKFEWERWNACCPRKSWETQSKSYKLPLKRFICVVAITIANILSYASWRDFRSPRHGLGMGQEIASMQHKLNFSSDLRRLLSAELGRSARHLWLHMHAPGPNLQHLVKWLVPLTSLCILQQTFGVPRWRHGWILPPISESLNSSGNSDWQRHTIPARPHPNAGPAFQSCSSSPSFASVLTKRWVSIVTPTWGIGWLMCCTAAWTKFLVGWRYISSSSRRSFCLLPSSCFTPSFFSYSIVLNVLCWSQRIKIHEMGKEVWAPVSYEAGTGYISTKRV